MSGTEKSVGMSAIFEKSYKNSSTKTATVYVQSTWTLHIVLLIRLITIVRYTTDSLWKNNACVFVKKGV